MVEHMIERGPKLHSALRKMGFKFDILGDNQPEGAVSFLETAISPMDCVWFGIAATLCTLLSSVAMFHFLYMSQYFHKVTDPSGELSFDEFTTLAERMYMGQAEDNGKSPTKWTLPPSGFSEEEKKLYLDFLAGKDIPVDTTKFQKRKEMEKRAYEEFLSESMFVRLPKDKHYLIKVAVPGMLYVVLHIITYIAAFNLGHG
jgi:hypothetical protein